MNPQGPRCPQLTDLQVSRCQNPVVLDVLAGVEVLGWDLMTHYQLVERLNDLDENYPTASDADLLTYGMTREDDDHFRRGQIDRDRRKICFAGAYAAGHYGVKQDLNDHDPEIGLWWSPSRKMRNSIELVECLEQRTDLAMMIHRTPGPWHNVELTNGTERALAGDQLIDRAICKACILFARQLRSRA